MEWRGCEKANGPRNKRKKANLGALGGAAADCLCRVRLCGEVVPRVLSSRHARGADARSQTFDFSGDAPEWSTSRVASLSTGACDEATARALFQWGWWLESVLCGRRGAHCRDWCHGCRR